MELRQLRYFVAVAEEGSFTRAAARLHLSQQSLSVAVQRLEAQLGCALLERGSQRVVPTAPGAALLARAPAVFAALDAATSAVHEAAGALHGEVRVRYGLDAEALVEPLLTAFQERHPRVALRAWSGADADNLAALRRGDVEAAFAWVAVPGDLHARVVAHERTWLALPDRHRLARLATVPPAEVVAEPLVMFPRESAPAVWDFLVARLRGGAEPDRARIVSTPVSGQATMTDRVLRGEGVCPVSETLAARLRRPGLVLRPLDPPVLTPLLLAWRTPTALVRRLAAEAAQEAGA